MPEGPEIARAGDWLRRFVGGTVCSISPAEAVKYEGKYATPEQVGRHLPATVDAAHSCGKLLWLECTGARGPLDIVFKLNLSGTLSTRRPNNPRLQLHMGAPLPTLWYDDPTGFGWVRLDPGGTHRKAACAALGPDPLRQTITTADLRAFAPGTRTRRSVAAKLLDQSVLAGIGNYLRAEIICEAGLKEDEWGAATLQPPKLEALAAAINTVMLAAYQQGERYVMKCYQAAGARKKTEGGRTLYYR
jgi:endonuclease-8